MTMKILAGWKKWLFRLALWTLGPLVALGASVGGPILLLYLVWSKRRNEARLQRLMVASFATPSRAAHKPAGVTLSPQPACPKERDPMSLAQSLAALSATPDDAEDLAELLIALAAVPRRVGKLRGLLGTAPAALALADVLDSLTPDPRARVGKLLGFLDLVQELPSAPTPRAESPDGAPQGRWRPALVPAAETKPEAAAKPEAPADEAPRPAGAAQTDDGAASKAEAALKTPNEGEAHGA